MPRSTIPETTMPATLALPTETGSAARPRAVRVRSADELRRALREARHAPLALDASGLDRVLRLDAGRGLIEVQAAAPWAALDRLGCAPFLPASIGEAVSANAAGPDGVPVSAHVAAITLVTADGELRRASREAQPELFRLALGGHGVFGVLYSVTLRIESLRRSAARAVVPVALELPAGAAPAAGPALEVLIPPERLEDYLAEAKALAGEHRLALEGAAVRRLAPESETVLRWATREWAGVVLRLRRGATLGASAHAAQVRRALLGTAIRLGGSFPIAGRPEASREQLEACYPGLAAFLAEKRRIDPCERLANGWYRHIAGLMRRAPLAARWSVSG
jgi:FAD/FMN-containing dehydrogenase